MKKFFAIIFLIFIPFFASHNHVKKLYIPDELMGMFFNYADNLNSTRVSNKSYELTQSCIWYHHKLCNRLINIVINAIQYKKKNKKGFDFDFLQLSPIFTKKKKQLLIDVYKYYLEVLYPRFCSINLLYMPDYNQLHHNQYSNNFYLHTQCFKQKKINPTATNHVPYVLFEFTRGNIILVNSYAFYHHQNELSPFIEDLHKTHKNIVRIIVYNYIYNFDQFPLSTHARKILEENQIIIQEGHHKTPFSTFPDPISKIEDSFSCYQSSFDKWLLSEDGSYPLLQAVNSHNWTIVKKILPFCWIRSNDKKLVGIHHKKQLEEIKNQIKKENPYQKTTLLLTFPSDNIELKNIFIDYRKTINNKQNNELT